MLTVYSMLDKTLKEKYETGNYHCIVKGKGHVVIDKFNGFNNEALLPSDSFEFGYSDSMKTEYIKVQNGSHIIYNNCKFESTSFYLKPKSEPISDYLLPGYQFKLGDIFYHIDFPNSECEIVKVKENYAYLLIANPSICKAFTIRTTDLNKTFFDSREDCIDARIQIAKRDLEFEISCKKMKI